MAARKVDFSLSWRTQITQLADLAVALNELNAAYFASGYNGGGADEIQDSDLEGHSLTAADVATMSTVTSNLELLLSNQVAAQGDYWTLINAVRNVG